MAVSRAVALRVAAHVAAWTPFMYGSVHAALTGWRPVSDTAGIALRSWDVLTVHAPLVGQASRLARGVYDPGPLQYWLLTVPVHIDPVRGVFWGAALWCMVAASLTIEAAWAAGGRFVGVLASLAVLGVLLWIPSITRLPCWNPWFGMMFFLAALAAGWAVMAGHRAWWAVLVIAGSIAAQAHLMFAFASAALVLVAFIVGLTDTVRSRATYGWVAAGFVAAAVCWVAPLAQEMTEPAGNLTALFDHRNAAGQTSGVVFGLKAVAASTQPPALWWTPLNSLHSLGAISSASAVSGVLALVLVSAALVAAIRPLRSRHVAALAGVSLLTALAAVATFSDVPATSVTMVATATNNLDYLMAPAVAVGILAWLAVGSALVLTGRRLMRPAAMERSERAGRFVKAVPYAPAVAAVALAFMAVIALPSLPTRPTLNNSVMSMVGVASHEIEAKLPGQPIALQVTGADHSVRRRLTFALVYALHSAGYRPEIRKNWAWQLGPAYEIEGRSVPRVTVAVRDTDVSVHYVKH